MPQEMNVLCCYSCKMYQVHIVKKARKWQCKLCNEKQSIQQIYFQGSGKDCRLHVQQLNSLKMSEMPFAHTTLEENSRSSKYNTFTNISQKSDNDTVVESKWTKYLNLSKEESLFDANDLKYKDTQNFTSVNKVKHLMSDEKSLYDATNSNLCNFDNTVNDFDSDFDAEGDIDRTEKLYSTNNDCNFNNDDKCNLQNDSKVNKNIFETYSELNTPLDL